MWRSEQFLTRASSWVDDVLAARGGRRDGALAEVKVRFWAAVYAVPLASGRAYLKAGNPGQAFEGELLAHLGRLAPAQVVMPWAVHADEGWWLLPDAGTTPERTPLAWDEVVDVAAVLQRACVPHGDTLAVVPRLDSCDAVGWAAAILDELSARPPTDPQHVDPGRAAHASARLPQLSEAMALLTATGLPSTLQPNDLHPGNAARGADGLLRLFDLGDAFWSHPWAALSSPLRGVGDRQLRDPRPDTPAVRRLLDRYAEHWPEVARADRTAVVEAADRLGCLQRAASWQRLLAPTDPARLGLPAVPRVADYLLRALA